ncbi:MAG: GNAT family N-acetyltransferase [Candidatus Promineifilaceae bacterium]
MLQRRLYAGDEDYWRIRTFLRDIYLRNGRRERSWQAYRFDYWRWHGIENLGDGRLEDIFLWEDEAGRLAAVLNQESHGQAFLQVDPDLRSAELETEMIATAEAFLARPNDEGDNQLMVVTNEADAMRQELLAARGYKKASWAEYQRRRPLDGPVPEMPLAPGYTVRSLGVGAELLERAYASGLAFHPDDINYAVQNRADIGWYLHIQNAPLYRRDLDLVAVAPDGAVASFCTIWFDDVTRTGAFEPVGTVPAHQRRGLAKAVMTEGLRRLWRLGATMATVGSYSLEAHQLYEAMGFTEYERGEPWSKSLA